VEEVGLTDELISIPRSHPAAKNRMIYANGHLSLLPNSLTDLFKVKPPLTKRLFTNLIKEISVPKSLEEDESVYDFFRRRFGNEVGLVFSLLSSLFSLLSSLFSLVAWQSILTSG
jgi:protoporphyrinogen/coproporphyrinogen III oxidase